MITGTFILKCRNTINSMRSAGMSETLIACAIQEIRSAALSEEFHRITEFIENNPPEFHHYSDVKRAIKEWND